MYSSNINSNYSLLGPGHTGYTSPPLFNFDSNDFSSLLFSLLTMMNSGGSSSSGLNMLLMPAMMSMMENMQAEQIVQPEPAGKPVEGRLTQGYHGSHRALDFGIPVGTPINTTMDGEVIFAGWNNDGYGNLVIVENGPYRTYYAHLSDIPVEVGEKVQRGSVIGLSGNTGNSTGPHLHYEVRVHGKPIDPNTSVYQPSRSVPYIR